MDNDRRTKTDIETTDSKLAANVAALTAAAGLGVRLTIKELVLVQQAYIAGECVAWLRSDLKEAAGHPDLHPAILENLLHHPNDQVVLSAALHPDLAPQRRSEILGRDEFAYTLSRVGWGPTHMLRHFAADSDAETRVKTVKSGRLPLDLVEALSTDPSPLVRAAVAGTVSTPELLRSLGQDSDESVVAALSENSNTPGDVLEALANRVDDIALGANPSTPPQVLRELAATLQLVPGWEFQPPEQRPRGRTLLSALAQNPNTPIDLLLIITDGATGGERAKDPAPQSKPQIRDCLAKNEELNTELFDRLSADADERVRYWVALNRAAPTSVLERLSQDEVTAVIGAVLRNSNVPHGVRERLYDDPCDLREYLYANKNTPSEMLESIALSYADTEDDRELSNLYELLLHPGLPQDALHGFATHPLAFVRQAVARSTVTSDEVREQLGTDPDEKVRTYAFGSQFVPLYMEWWLDD